VFIGGPPVAGLTNLSLAPACASSGPRDTASSDAFVRSNGYANRRVGSVADGVKSTGAMLLP
jgi:hypothetical protein